MKKILSVMISLAIVLSFAVIPYSASSYAPEDKYTVSADTPTCEEAIEACGGDLNDMQKIYFQLPAEDAEHPDYNWTNPYNSADLGLDYCQVCVYWWQGVGSEWPDSTKVQWVGYKAKLSDAENRIYEAAVPADGDVSPIIWNNGFYGGDDPTQEIFRYAHQLTHGDVTGAEPGDYDTLPEGSPDPDSMNGCIQIPEKVNDTTAVLINQSVQDFNWYVYYGDGCYGNYPMTSAKFHGQYASCVNPEHDHSDVVYLRGDADNDGEISILDATVIQRKLVNISVQSFHEKAADVDGNGLDITDATLIRRYMAAMNDPYHIGELVSE